MTKKFGIKTKNRVELIDITALVQKAVQESGIAEGTCTVFIPHTTAGVTINENADPDVVRDIEMHLAKLVPEHGGFRHGEGNSDSHIKALFTGASLTVIVDRNKLLLGTWQGIYFCEYDGPRDRQFYVNTIAG
ncbi:MAG TPA: secondary thiamine-phosphate synthase enzyme YjbQ [Nitrospirota bacterium]|jgi:secondary thiamine-phosphate synthase enzyme